MSSSYAGRGSSSRPGALRRGDTWKAIVLVTLAGSIPARHRVRASPVADLGAKLAQTVAHERPIDPAQRRDIADESDHGQVEEPVGSSPAPFPMSNPSRASAVASRYATPAAETASIWRIVAQLGRRDDGSFGRRIDDPVMIEHDDVHTELLRPRRPPRDPCCRNRRPPAGGARGGQVLDPGDAQPIPLPSPRQADRDRLRPTARRAQRQRQSADEVTPSVS